jgi:hypothetical protein
MTNRSVLSNGIGIVRSFSGNLVFCWYPTQHRAAWRFSFRLFLKSDEIKTLADREDILFSIPVLYLTADELSAAWNESEQERRENENKHATSPESQLPLLSPESNQAPEGL